MNPLRRTLAGLMATSIVGAGLALAGATPAHATVGTIDSGSPISRTAIVERALSWTTEPVPYSQTSYYPATAPRTGTGHSYRQDCSGFLSMAWNLPTSAITTDFVSSSSAYDTRLPSFAALQRGDMLGTSGHVVLFLGWSADDAGRHRYFDMVSEAHTGTDASVATDQDLDGYWSSYVPYTFKHAVADLPQTAPFGGTRTDEVTLNAAGHVIHSWQANASAAWASEDLTAAHNFPILRTAPAIASPAAGQLAVIGTGQNGALLDFAFNGTAWSEQTLTTSGDTYGVGASGYAGRVDIVGRQVGSSTADAMGTLWHGSLVGTTWTGWSEPAGVSLPILGDPAVADGPGFADTVVESPSGTLEYGTWTTSTVSWTWTAPFGTARVTTQPAVSRLSDGTIAVVASIGGVLEQDDLAPGATTWSGWSSLTPPPLSTAALAVRTPLLTAGRTARVIHVPAPPVVPAATRTP